MNYYGRRVCSNHAADYVIVYINVFRQSVPRATNLNVQCSNEFDLELGVAVNKLRLRRYP
jgi:hypothetical protein